MRLNEMHQEDSYDELDAVKEVACAFKDDHDLDDYYDYLLDKLEATGRFPS